MIKIPLIALLFFCAAYGWRQRSISPLLGILIPLASLSFGPIGPPSSRGCSVSGAAPTSSSTYGR